MRLKGTHTFVEMPIAPDAWDYIAELLRDAGYTSVFCDDAIDMHGIGLTKDETATGVNYVISLATEISQLRRRRDDLLLANNEFEERARRAEAESRDLREEMREARMRRMDDPNGNWGHHGIQGWYSFQGTPEERQELERKHLETCNQCREQAGLPLRLFFRDAPATSEVAEYREWKKQQEADKLATERDRYHFSGG